MRIDVTRSKDDETMFLLASSREPYLIEVFGRAMDRLVAQRRRERIIAASRRFGYFFLRYELWSEEFDELTSALGLKYRWRRDGRSGVAGQLRQLFPWAVRSGLTIVPRSDRSGSPYRCQKIKALSTGRGCVDFIARSEEEALLTCALIAGSNGWLGGAHSPGRCRDV